MRRIAALLAVLTATALPAPADAVELAETEWYSRMTYGHGTDESTTTEAALLVLPRFGISAGSAWIEISARARFDPADELEPTEPDYDYYTDASRPATFGDDTTMELRDFYVELPLGSSLLRLGKQQLVWGNLLSQQLCRINKLLNVDNVIANMLSGVVCARSSCSNRCKSKPIAIL